MNELHELDKELDGLFVMYNECKLYYKRLDMKTSDINGMCISKIRYAADDGVVIWTLVNGVPIAYEYDETLQT